MVKKKQSKSILSKVSWGLAAASVTTAVGAYFVYERSGVKTRRKIKGWALKAKGEILESLEGLGEINEKIYRDIIDEVVKKYKGAKNIDTKEVEKLVSELKGHWKKIMRDHEAKGRKSKPSKKRKTASKKSKKARNAKTKK